MYIEIRKAGFLNKGAQLMLHSIINELNREFPEAKFVMAPHPRLAPFEDRARMGFLQKAWYWRFGRQWGNLARFIPARIRKMYGITLDKQIDVVIDAAGFSYSDNLGTGNMKELADSCKRWKKNDTTIIMLPQAFGPFKNQRSKRLMKTVTEKADLIFARDEISFQHISNLITDKGNIKTGPDFTNLLEGKAPGYFDPVKYKYCLIPNWRMIRNVDNQTSDNYISFMVTCARYLQQQNVNPFFLIHEGEQDKVLADKINSRLEEQIDIIHEDDPVKLKGIIGSCEGTIGSRFHGLVSALSQGVPSLATAWSHKYQMLMKEYDFEQGLVQMDMDKDEVHEKLDMIIDDHSRKHIKQSLMKQSEELKLQTGEMWKLVIQTIRK